MPGLSMRPDISRSNSSSSSSSNVSSSSERAVRSNINQDSSHAPGTAHPVNNFDPDEMATQAAHFLDRMNRNTAHASTRSRPSASRPNRAPSSNEAPEVESHVDPHLDRAKEERRRQAEFDRLDQIDKDRDMALRQQKSWYEEDKAKMETENMQSQLEIATLQMRLKLILSAVQTAIRDLIK